MGACASGERWHDDFDVILQRYQVDMSQDGIIGQGSFSVCFRGWDMKTKSPVAVKVYKTSTTCDRSILDRFQRQVRILEQLQRGIDRPHDPALWHPHISAVRPGDLFLRLVDFSCGADGQPGPDRESGKMYLVTELAEETLQDFIDRQRKSRKALDRSHIRSLSRSIVLIVAALHAKGLVHLDLKPENILLCSNGRPKLSDVDGCVPVGSAVSRSDPLISFTLCYCAPEWARFVTTPGSSMKAEPSLDVWSTGLTLLELVTMRSVIDEKFIELERKGRGFSKWVCPRWLGNLESHPVPSLVDDFDSELYGFLTEGLLNPAVSKRQSLAQSLAHPYIAGAEVQAWSPRLDMASSPFDAPQQPKSGTTSVRMVLLGREAEMQPFSGKVKVDTTHTSRSVATREDFAELEQVA